MSEKSTLSFLSPNVLLDSSSSPGGTSTKTGGHRSSAAGGLSVSSILEYDWLNSEDDDDDDAMPSDPSEQLLADSDNIDEAKWTEQWDFHTSQLQQKRLLKQQQSETEPEFEPCKKMPALGKKSVSAAVDMKDVSSGNSAGGTFNIKPFRKFSETLANVSTTSDTGTENVLDEDASSTTSVSNATASILPGTSNGDEVCANGKVLNPDSGIQSRVMVAPPPRSSTPNSLVDYDSDSDEEETKSETEINTESNPELSASEDAKSEDVESADTTSPEETLQPIVTEESDSDNKSNKRQLDSHEDENCFETSVSEVATNQQTSSPPRKRSKSFEESVLDESA